MDKEACKERILSEDSRDFIVSRSYRRQGEDPLICTVPAGEEYEILYVEKEMADPISYSTYPYDTIPHCYCLEDLNALQQMGVIKVQKYPTLELMGEGILLGFIDTGIAYQNPIFQNLDKTSRIEGIWDQEGKAGEPPEGLYYGVEFTKEMLDENIRTQGEVLTEDENGHGTFLASLAAGGGEPGEQFCGAAPMASLGVVKLKQGKEYLREFYGIKEDAVFYQENDIMLGIRYLVTLAEKKKMPLVLCLALGTSFGGHDGNTPLEREITKTAERLNQIIVTGTGNEANARHHYAGKLRAGQSEEVELQVEKDTKGFSMEFWTEFPNLYTVSIVSPSGEEMQTVAAIGDAEQVEQFLFEGTKVEVQYKIFTEGSSAQLIRFRFFQVVSGIWKIKVNAVGNGDGIYHMWLPVTEFLEEKIVFLRPEPNVTITSPGTANVSICVSYYNGYENSVAIQSGRGYTRDERIKPDFSAPGVNVKGVLSEGRITTRSGSSLATALVTGVTALLLQWILDYQKKKGADTLQIRNVLLLGTEQKMENDYPNQLWGYGTVNLYNTLSEIRKL